ncbi:DUF2256 domain-containing protein [Aliiruegeria sabulilitoris]|uniref:DUF2256 domain-containing protein n=1 Tax=Aliiruegeria sabulilitoris TaxID=1510458 RepID=UPI0009E96154|nr:DUF2256 domain-containing protein [Aliiruegeria sabulilitoris]
MMSTRPLPEKPCVQCGRPFSWRKKWQRDWEAVRYCSARCRGEARTARHGTRKGAINAARGMGET